MRLGLVVHPGREHALEFAARLEREAAHRDIAVGPVSDDADIVIAVGGDGTMLEALQEGIAHRLPTLGFNLGTVGFLTEAEPEALTSVLDALAEGRFTVAERMTVDATLSDGAQRIGVNDVVIEKIESQRLIVLDLEVDGTHFLTYRADGVVVATSTGSTAYAFSAGGPLVDPSLDVILVTPVAPHSLFNRTLVLDPSATLRCTVTAHRPVLVSVDGLQLGTMEEGDAVVIERAAERARFVVLEPQSFASRITHKFGVD
jgi:NAD+ kinase